MHNIMQAQAGTRSVYAMTNGKMTLTTHYKNREEFEQRLREKNDEIERWGGDKWEDCTK